MDELGQFCGRMLGDGEAARAAEQEARATGVEGRVAILSAAVVACRARTAAALEPSAQGDQGQELADAVAGELAAATARLPERQREALALRELLGLSYAEMAAVTGMEDDAVAPRAGAGADAPARRAARRGRAPPGCAERDRALRVMALRQDGSPVSATTTTG